MFNDQRGTGGIGEELEKVAGSATKHGIKKNQNEQRKNQKKKKKKKR